MQRFFKNWVVAVVVLVLVLAGAILWWRSRGGEKLSFTTADVKRGEVSATISASGTIEPLEVVDIGAQVEPTKLPLRIGCSLDCSGSVRPQPKRGRPACLRAGPTDTAGPMEKSW